jgi:hypothetical protein
MKVNGVPFNHWKGRLFMKKLLALILTAILLLCFASCEVPAHKQETDTTPPETTTPEHTEHTGRWLSFETGHSYQFTCGCPSAAVLELHYDNDGDLICDVCDYEMPAKTCTQPFEWVGNEEGHVMHMLCDCCDAPDVIEPHEDKNGDLVCDLCNYIMPVPEHTEHTGRWGCGEEAHWYEYTCGCVNNDIAELHYDYDNNGLCDACAYMVGVKQYYSLMMSAPEWLYEELKHTYYEGETVSVKISMATDVGFLFFVNGEELTDYQDVDGLYWEFTFEMPACDTYVHFKTYDGFLPDVNYGTLIETYYRQNLDAPFVHVRHYYCEFASGAIVAMLDTSGYDAYLWDETIGDTVIHYRDGNRIVALCPNNKFYTLTEAFENGYLTAEDIAAIAEMHNNQ